jgi:septal ring factor EnvC (AmiA/AmiB activator)
MHVTKTSETQSQSQQLESAAPSKRSSRKSILALSVFALGLNATAAVYTLSPSDFALPNVSSLAELLPHQKASDPIPDPVVAALKDIQSAQQQHVASLQENSSLLQQNTALLEQDSTTLASLRESITDEHVDVKKISAQITDEHVDVKKMSAQIATLIAKVDSLKNAITPEVTSSIPKGRARNRLSRVVRNRMARQPKPVGPVSVGGAPVSLPTTAPHTEG